MTGQRRRRVLAAMVAAVAASAAPAALAHAGLVSAEPGRRATLTVPPARIRLCFSEKVEAAYSSVALQDGSGAEVALAPPRADPDEPTCLLVPLEPLRAGSYTVKYRVLSIDGHIVDYGYGFRLAPP